MNLKINNCNLIYQKIFVIIFVFYLIIISSCSKNVPDEIKTLIFEGPRFSKPLVYDLPCDEAKKEKQFLNWREKYDGGLPIIHFSVIQNIDKNLLNYLVSNQMANVNTYKLNTSIGKRDYRYLRYTDKIKSYLVNPNVNCMNWELRFGKRILNSITYTNEYEAETYGVKAKFFAITFSYHITSELPNMSVKKNEYEGKAKVYLDPDDGKWKLDNIDLNDSELGEYLFNL